MNWDELKALTVETQNDLSVIKDAFLDLCEDCEHAENVPARNRDECDWIKCTNEDHPYIMAIVTVCSWDLCPKLKE